MAIYHLTVKTGSRSNSQSARAKADYIQRQGKYAKDRDDVAHTQSGNLPTWAEGQPGAYWEAADQYERANGRLYREIEFALPRELNLPQMRELVEAFAEHLTSAEKLPWTLAIHTDEGNPHCHLMVSERVNDGMAREAGQWFKRYNAKEPGKGGARKTESMKPQGWLEQTRAAWADQANRSLERAGVEARIDHRSLADQGLDRAPTEHLGPHVLEMEKRGIETERTVEIEARQAHYERERAERPDQDQAAQPPSPRWAATRRALWERYQGERTAFYAGRKQQREALWQGRQEQRQKARELWRLRRQVLKSQRARRPAYELPFLEYRANLQTIDQTHHVQRQALNAGHFASWTDWLREQSGRGNVAAQETVARRRASDAPERLQQMVDQAAEVIRQGAKAEVSALAAELREWAKQEPTKGRLERQRTYARRRQAWEGRRSQLHELRSSAQALTVKNTTQGYSDPAQDQARQQIEREQPKLSAAARLEIERRRQVEQRERQAARERRRQERERSRPARSRAHGRDEPGLAK